MKTLCGPRSTEMLRALMFFLDDENTAGSEREDKSDKLVGTSIFFFVLVLELKLYFVLYCFNLP